MAGGLDIHAMEGLIIRTTPASESSGHQSESDEVWTRRCACCYLFITTSDDINLIQPSESPKAFQKHTVHEMLSKIFLLPKDIMVEEELKCCSKCSLLIHKGFQWFQALKKVVYKQTKIHTLLKTLQEQNLKIKIKSLLQTAKYHQNPVTPVSTTATTPVQEPNTLHLNTIWIPQQIPLCSVSEVPVSLPLLSGVMPSTPTPTLTPPSVSIKTLRVQKPDPCQTSESDNPETVIATKTPPGEQKTMRINSIRILRRNSKVPTLSSDTPAHSFKHETNFVAPSVPREQILSNKDSKKTGATRKRKAAVIQPADERDPLALDIGSPDPLFPSAEITSHCGPSGTVSLPSTNPTARDLLANCTVIFPQETFSTSPLLVQKQWLDPYFSCCQFCEDRIYGIDPDSACQLMIKHYEEHHSKQNKTPTPTMETVSVYPTGTKVFSACCKFCYLRFFDAHKHIPRTKLHAHCFEKHQSSVQCPQCPTILRSGQGQADLQCKLKLHIEVYHERKSKYTCEICEKPMTSNSAMKVHMRSHMNQEERNAEIEKTPSIRKSCLCPICGVVLQSHCQNQEQLLKNHIASVHSDKKQKPRFSCEKCDFSTTTKQTLAQHHLAHVEGAWCKFVCKRCGKGYVAGQGRKYKEHILVCCDEKERPVQCPEADCFKRFKCKQPILMHLMDCHKKTPEQAREILYPGLPMRDWIRNMKKKPKKNKELPEVNILEIPMELPGFQAEMEEESPIDMEEFGY